MLEKQEGGAGDLYSHDPLYTVATQYGSLSTSIILCNEYVRCNLKGMRTHCDDRVDNMQRSERGITKSRLDTRCN